MKVRNPRTGELDYEIAPLDVAELTMQAKNLRARQAAWAALSVKQPASHLQALPLWAISAG